MLNIGIRAHDMEPAPIDTLIKNINKKGLKCTQLALSKAVNDFNVTPDMMTPGFAMHLKREFFENKVDVSVLGCYLELGNGNQEEFEKIAKIYEAHIRFAAMLGCGMVGTETWTGNMKTDSEEAIEKLIENMKRIVSYAEKFGVIIGMEPVAHHIVSDFKKARRVLDAVNSPNLRIIFDPVNVITAENYQNQINIIDEAFKLCGEEIVCIHAKDFVIDAEGKKKDVIAGDGLLDYRQLCTYLRKTKPYIHILLEETTPDNVMNAKEYIENIYEKC